MGDVTPTPQPLNRAGRRAEARTSGTSRTSRTRKAGALAAAFPAALGTTALLLGAAATPADALCSLQVSNLTDTGAGSLRDAVSCASDGDVITFQSGLTGTIPLGSDIAVGASVTIQGPGADVIAVSGQDLHRIFDVSIGGGASGSFTVSGLTLEHGRDAGGGAVLDANEDLTFTGVTFLANHSTSAGGAIHAKNASTDIVVTDSTFTDNSAAQTGAAITMRNGESLTITDSTFTGNTATGNGVWYSDIDVKVENSTFDHNASSSRAGGALYLYQLASVTITGSQFTNNVAGAAGGAGKIEYSALSIADSSFSANSANNDGGGLYVGEADGPVTISTSTFADNSAGDDGGGLVWYDSFGAFTLRNSTLSGNTADSTGGGLYLAYPQAPEATAAILNSTISGNSAGENGGGITTTSYYGVDIVQSTITANTAPQGAGIFIPVVSSGSLAAPKGPGLPNESGPVAEPRTKKDGAYAVTTTGSIIAQNVGTDVEEGGTLTATSSIIGKRTGTALVDKGGNLFNVDPLLGALADNGGPTKTHALLPGSPAIDAGPNPLTPFPGSDFDQRGDGYARVVAGIVDIGAFEVQPVIIQPTFTG